VTATEVLRRMLDERGVEYFKHEDGEPLRKLEKADKPATSWRLGNASVCAVPIDGSDLFDLWIDHCTPEQAVEATLGTPVTGETSDGYHTFNELYHHRAVLFSVIVRDHIDRAWKSKAHHDGTMYDGMFIVGIETPEGQATYHYDIDPYWDMFDCKELDQAPEWDGHTPDDAIERIATLGNEESYTRDDVESAFVSGYSLGCLPVGSDPQWDQNEQTVDEHMAELGWVRAATERGVVE